MSRVLPIAADGRLLPDATFILLGFMFHPEDERSAGQLARLMEEETREVDNDNSLSEHAESICRSLRTDLLSLVGEMSIFVAHNIVNLGEPLIGKAAHAVSENQSTNTNINGKPLPTSASRIRKYFNKYLSVVHFWAALHLQRETESDNSLEELLSNSLMFLEIFERAKWASEYNPWCLSKFDGLQMAEWPEGGIVANRDDLEAIMTSYSSRSGKK